MRQNMRQNYSGGHRSQRSRNKNRGQNLSQRMMDSNGPDVKIKGTAVHIYKKYQTLARDAVSSGDRLRAENYLQHADHYYRLSVVAQAQQQHRQSQEAQSQEGGSQEAQSQEAGSQEGGSQEAGSQDAQSDNDPTIDEI